MAEPREAAGRMGLSLPGVNLWNPEEYTRTFILSTFKEHIEKCDPIWAEFITSTDSTRKGFGDEYAAIPSRTGGSGNDVVVEKVAVIAED